MLTSIMAVGLTKSVRIMSYVVPLPLSLLLRLALLRSLPSRQLLLLMPTLHRSLLHRSPLKVLLTTCLSKS